MNITDLVIFIVIGAVAGCLAGWLMTGAGVGLPDNILLGIIGERHDRLARQ